MKNGIITTLVVAALMASAILLGAAKCGSNPEPNVSPSTHELKTGKQPAPSLTK